MKILVTDGETRAALAAVRSLAAAGHEIAIASSDTRPLAGASRSVNETHVLPDPHREPDAFQTALGGLVAGGGFDLVLPIAEITLALLYDVRGIDFDRVLAPTRAAFDRAVDKHGLIEVAKDVGLDAPRSVLVEDVPNLARLPDGFTYPVVLKARRSRFRFEGEWRNGGVAILEDEGALAEARNDPGFAGGAMLQEFLEGHGEAVFLLMAEGQRCAAFAHRRLREKPPSGGVSTLRESIAPDPALLAGSERLLAALDFQGVAMVEFRRTPGGRAALMEINPRLWGSLQLAIDAGIDFPDRMVRLHQGEPTPEAIARPGVRTRWLLGDFDHLLICLLRPAMRRATGRSVLGVVLDFFRSFFDGTHSEVLTLRDPRPFLRECSQWWRN